VFIIERTDTLVTDVLLSVSATTPTMPASYTKKRRIGSFKTNASAQILTFAQFGDHFLLGVSTKDVDTASPGTSAVIAAMNVPTGVQVDWEGMLTLAHGASSAFILITSPDQTDTAPDSTSQYSIAQTDLSFTASSYWRTRTNTSGQIRYRSSQGTVTTWRIQTFGWFDRRGQS
jgi:hypothetical protein